MAKLTVRRARDLGSDVALGSVFGVAAVLAATGPRPIGALLVAIGVSCLVVRGALDRRRLRFRFQAFAQFPALRALAVAGVLVVLETPPRASGDLAAASLAAVVLLSALVLEPVLGRLLGRTVPVAVGLPGLPTGAARPIPELSLLVVHTAALILGVVAGLLGLPGWVWLLGALAVVALSIAVTWEGRRRAVLSETVLARVPAAVADYAPQIILHTAHNRAVSHQVMMWLPYLARTGLRVLVVTRFPAASQALRDLVEVPLVEAPELSDLDAVVVPSVRAVFYPNAKIANGFLVRRHPQVHHVYVNHGDSDKATSYAPSHAMYDKIYCAGPAAVRRYADHGVQLSPEKFQVVGRPQVEDLEQARGPLAVRPDPTVLYAPTWRGFGQDTAVSSLPVGHRIVAGLLRTRATVVFRPHPSSYNFLKDRRQIAKIHALLAEDAQRTGRAHLFGPAADRTLDITGCMNVADAMISDVSGVASDFLFTRKPLAMVAVPSRPEEFRRRFPVARGAYVVRKNLANLPEVLEQLLGADPLASARARMRVDYLGDFPVQGYAAAFVDAARRIASGPPRPAAGVAPTPAPARVRVPSAPKTLRGRAGRLRRELIGWQTRNKIPVLGLAAVVLGTASLGLALSGASRWLVLLLTAATLAGVFALGKAHPTRFWTWLRLVERGSAAKAPLVAAVALAQSGPPVLTALLAAGLGAALAVERLEFDWRRLWPVTRNLPGVRAPDRELFPGLLAVLVMTVELVALVLAVPVLSAVLGIGLLLGAVAIGIRAFRLVVAGGNIDVTWRRALAAYAPAFAVYVGNPTNPTANFAHWLPYLRQLGRFVVITHDTTSVDPLDRACHTAGLAVPIVHRYRLRDVERAVPPSMTTAFYVNNALINTQLMGRRDVHHVLLTLTDGEGPENWSPLTAMYDRIFVPGQAAIDRYAAHGVHIPTSKFEIVGRPQTDPVHRGRAGGEVATVLFAPTWYKPGGPRFSSLRRGPEIVAQILEDGFRVVFRPNRLYTRYAETRRRTTEVHDLLRADQAATGREHVFEPDPSRTRSLVEDFNASDALLCDGPGLLYDYLRSGKPFAVFRRDGGDGATLPLLDAGYRVAIDASNLVAVLHELSGADPLAPARARARAYYLGPFPDTAYDQRFLDAARAVIAARPALPEQESALAEQESRHQEPGAADSASLSG